MPSMCVGMEGAPHEGVAERFSETNTMKKILAALVAFAALTAAPALGADLGARPNHSNGYTVGTGVEYMFAPNWSAKGEYMYYNFGSSRFVTPAALAPFGSFHTDDHTLKLGVNYRFNFASPVVARY